VIAGVSWGLPDDAVDLLLPAVPLVLLMVDVVVEHSVVSGEHRFDVPESDVEGSSALFSQSATEGPD